MADDEEAVAVLACKTISCFIIIIYYFSSQMEFIHLLKNYGNYNFIHITNKVAYRVCRARRDELVALVVTDASRLLRLSRRAVTCCVALAVQHA